MKKTFSLAVDGDELVEFIDYLELRLKDNDYSYTYRDGRIYVAFYGKGEKIRGLKMIVRQAYRDFMAVHRPAKGKRRYPKGWLLENCRGIPLSLLTMVLAAKGHETALKEGSLVANVELEELLSTISDIREIFWETRLEMKERKVREVMVTASLITKRPTLNLLSEAIGLGLVEKTGGGLQFRTDPSRVLSKLIGKEDPTSGVQDER